MKDVNLLACPYWANDLIFLDWLSRQSSLSTGCKYALNIGIYFIRISCLVLSFTDSLASGTSHTTRVRFGAHRNIYQVQENYFCRDPSSQDVQRKKGRGKGIRFMDFGTLEKFCSN